MFAVQEYSSVVNYLLDDDFLRAAVCLAWVSYTDVFFYARRWALPRPRGSPARMTEARSRPDPGVTRGPTPGTQAPRLPPASERCTPAFAARERGPCSRHWVWTGRRQRGGWGSWGTEAELWSCPRLCRLGLRTELACSLSTSCVPVHPPRPCGHTRDHCTLVPGQRGLCGGGGRLQRTSLPYNESLLL